MSVDNIGNGSYPSGVIVQLTRRHCFVLADMLSLMVWDLLGPGIFAHLFDRMRNPSEELQSPIVDWIQILLSSEEDILYSSHQG